MLRAALLFAILFFTTTVAAQDTLRPGDVVAGSVSQGDTASYVTEVAAGHFIMGEIMDLTGDAIVELLNPEGRAVAGTTYPLAFAFETSEAGQYQLQIFVEDEIFAQNSNFLCWLVSQLDGYGDRMPVAPH